MATVLFNFSDFLGYPLENPTCQLKPIQPATVSGVLRLNSSIYVEDGELLDLLPGKYILRLSGNHTKLEGYIDVLATHSNIPFSSILTIVSDANKIPLGTPISAITGLQAELNQKVDLDDPRLNNIPTQAQLTKLNGIATGATKNLADDTLLNRSFHTGTQPISTITDLEQRLVIMDETNAVQSSWLSGLEQIVNGKADSSSLTPINNNITALGNRVTDVEAINATQSTAITSLQNEPKITAAEKTKLAGIQDNATQNQTDAVLLSRSNHTGTQAQSTITGLETRLTGIETTNTTQSTNITSLQNEPKITTAEKDKLAGIQSGATLNSTDAFLLSRANHTGTQPISSIANLLTELSNRVLIGSSTNLDLLQVNTLRFTFSGTNIDLTPYQHSVTERGVSVDLLRVNKGRIDFAPFEDKAEVRISGANTQLGFYNTSAERMLLSVQSSTGDTAVSGKMIATNFNFSTTSSLGSAGVQGDMRITSFNDSAIGIWNGGAWNRVPNKIYVDDTVRNSTFRFVGSSIPTTQVNGDLWREPIGSGYRVWVWNSSLSLWLTAEPIDYAAATVFNGSATTAMNILLPRYHSGCVIEQLSLNLSVSAAQSGTVFWAFGLRRGLYNNTRTTYPNTSPNTQAIVAINTEVNLNLLTTNTPVVIPWAGTSTVDIEATRTGTSNLTAVVQGVMRYYR